MGYRSQVAFVAQGPKEHIIAVLTTWRLTPLFPEELEHVMRELYLHTDSDNFCSLTYQDECKWYNSYHDVQMFEQLFDLLRQDKENISTAFVRIGEDEDDTETHYSGSEPYSLVALHRSVSIEASVGEPLRETSA